MNSNDEAAAEAARKWFVGPVDDEAAEPEPRPREVLEIRVPDLRIAVPPRRDDDPRPQTWSLPFEAAQG